MRLPAVVALALVVAVTASMPASGAPAASDCPKLVELADWGENSTGDISVAPGQSCLFPITIRGTVNSSEILKKPAYGKLKKLNADHVRIQGEGQVQGKRQFCHQGDGSGTEGFRHVGHHRERHHQVVLLAVTSRRRELSSGEGPYSSVPRRPRMPLSGLPRSVVR